MQATVAQTLLLAAKSGNLDQLKAAFGPTAQSCKACHDDFRRK
jgi:cytochrome c556